MKYLSSYDNIFETETWYFWGNMKFLLRHLDWGLDTKGPHSDPAENVVLGQSIAINFSKWPYLLLKNG